MRPIRSTNSWLADQPLQRKIVLAICLLLGLFLLTSVVTLNSLRQPEGNRHWATHTYKTLLAPCVLSVNGNPVDVRIGASIGIATYLPHDRPDAGEQLMQAADHAMYEAKRSGKNRCVLAG